MNVLQFIESARQQLEAKGISESRLNAELMLCHVLNCDRMRLYLDFDKPLKFLEQNELDEILNRRLQRIPLQYVLGKVSFYGYEFAVDNCVLIPRPETEVLVNEVLKSIRHSELKSVDIFEIGTGSGCISISLAKELDKTKTAYNINSIDISPQAIALADRNAETLGPFTGKLMHHKRDLFEITSLKRNVDYIVANPPYIAADNIQELEEEIRLHEPLTSLTDGNDGLRFYKKIFELISKAGITSRVFCEIGYGQMEKLTQLLRASGLENYRFVDDLSGIPRVLIVNG